jgi:hypothetical protein
MDISLENMYFDKGSELQKPIPVPGNVPADMARLAECSLELKKKH